MNHADTGTHSVYIVDDDQSILSSLQGILIKEGYTVSIADNAETFLSGMERQPPAVAILDIFLGCASYDGEDLIGIINERFPATQCIVISGESDIQKTLSCLRKGALDFLEKPVSLPRLITSVRNALSIYQTKKSIHDRYAILGESAAIRDVIARARKIAALNESVLIRGENGTGKELLAANIHLCSSRYASSLHCVNCTALNPNVLESELFGHVAGSFTGAEKDKKGYFAIARGSSLFIDEIGDFPLNLQSKILRVVQEKTVTPVGSTTPETIDVRLLFATHHNLEDMMKAGAFRQDLFFRISTFTIEIPPLRDRREDILVLAPHFLTAFIKENGLLPKQFSPEAMEKLCEYPYPGNVRELAKIVKNAAFFAESDLIKPEDIDLSPDAHREDIWLKSRKLSLSDAKAAFEKDLLLRRLAACNGNMKTTADSLGILVNNLYRKLREHDIAHKEI